MEETSEASWRSFATGERQLRCAVKANLMITLNLLRPNLGEAAAFKETILVVRRVESSEMNACIKYH